MAHFHGAVGNGVSRLQPRDDLAACENLDVKISISRGFHMFRHGLGRAIDGVQRLRK